MQLARRLTVLASTILLTPLVGAVAPASASTSTATDSCADYPYATAGQFGEDSAREFVPYPYFVPVEGVYTACLDGPAGTNFDLELLRFDSASEDYQVIAASRRAGSTERLTWDSPAGSAQYRLKVVAVEGNGPFTVAVRFPYET